MAKTSVSDVRPYVERAIKDEEIRDNLKNAFTAARDVYDELMRPRGVSGKAARVAADQDVRDERREERAPQRVWVEAAGLRDVARLQQDRPRLRGRARDAGQVARDLGEVKVLLLLPRLQVRRRVDGAVVAKSEVGNGVNLEVEV